MSVEGQKGSITYLCKECGNKTTKEQAEGTFEKYGNIMCIECEAKQKGAAPGSAQIDDKKDVPKPPKPEPAKEGKDGKENLPARREEKRAIEKRKSDAQISEEIGLKKTRDYYKHRGDSYKVAGVERPDAHQTQRVANEQGISIVIVRSLQNDDFAEVIVRAYLGEQFVDAIVHHDFKTEYQIKTLEILAKNPEILDHWEGDIPVLKEKAKVTVHEGGREIQKDAKYHIVHTLLSFKRFAIRDARTKAASIAEGMLLNQDFRDQEEKDSEEEEKLDVQKRREAERAGSGKA